MGGVTKRAREAVIIGGLAWDWEALREEYLAGGISQRALADRRGVPLSALRRKAREEGWKAQRDGESRKGEDGGNGKVFRDEKGFQGSDGEAGKARRDEKGVRGEDGRTEMASQDGDSVQGADGEAGKAFRDEKGVQGADGGTEMASKDEDSAQSSDGEAGKVCRDEKIDGDEDSDAVIAQRVRRRMLIKLEQMAEAMPSDPVTELKTQVDSTVSLFKLRDLTAAYKELTGDLPLGGEQEAVRVIVDP